MALQKTIPETQEAARVCTVGRGQGTFPGEDLLSRSRPFLRQSQSQPYLFNVTTNRPLLSFHASQEALDTSQELHSWRHFRRPVARLLPWRMFPSCRSRRTTTSLLSPVTNFLSSRPIRVLRLNKNLLEEASCTSVVDLFVELTFMISCMASSSSSLPRLSKGGSQALSQPVQLTTIDKVLHELSTSQLIVGIIFLWLSAVNGRMLPSIDSCLKKAVGNRDQTECGSASYHRR
jgi:hypothetical protein